MRDMGIGTNLYPFEVPTVTRIVQGTTLAGSVDYGSGGKQLGSIPLNIPPTCFFPAKQHKSGKSVFIGVFMDDGEKA